MIAPPNRALPAVDPAFAPERILILKPCCLGDVVQATALLTAVHQRWPDAAITIGASRWLHPVMTSHPAARHVIDAGNVGIRGRQRPGETLRLARLLRRSRFDLAIVPDRAPLLSVLTWLAGIPVRAGLDSGGRGRWYTVRVTPLPGAHEMDQAARLAAALGAAPLPLPNVVPSDAGRAEAEGLWRELGAPARLAVIAPGGGENPGANMPEKRWRVRGFAKVAQQLRQAGALVALAGSGSDRLVTADMLREAPGALDLAGRTSLDTLMALFGRAAVFVGNDSGTTHLAAACGCRTVAIFGPTAPERYAPRGRWVRVVAPPAALRVSGDGSVRQPYTFSAPWQDTIAASEVTTMALDGLAASEGEG